MKILSVCGGILVFALAVMAGRAADCQSDTNGLVGWWAAEGDSRNSVDGIFGQVDGGLSFVPGEIGQAFNFNGTNADVEAGPSTNLAVGQTNGFTIEAWINPADVTPSQPLVEWTDGTWNGLMFWISIPPVYGGNGAGSLTLAFAGIGSPELSTSADLIRSNIWQHVAATYDLTSGMAALYINGTLICQTNYGSAYVASSSRVWFGYDAATNYIVHPFGANYRYTGQMDEVLVYNRALSAAEIQATYNAGLCPLPATTVSVQPTNEVALTGNTATFIAAANGSAPLSYQWFFNGTNALDATGATLALTNAQPSQSGAYSVQVSNTLGLVFSSNVMLLVSNATPPLITLQPTNQTAGVSNAVTFRVISTGTAPLVYQWTVNGNKIPNATNASLTLSNVLFANAGVYSVSITNMAGIVESSNATLTIAPQWMPAHAPKSGWTCIASSADGTRLVAANAASLYDSSGPIYRSADSGTNWLPTSAPTNIWGCIACSSDGSKLVAGQSVYTGAIYLSTNAGVDWLKSSAPTGGCYSVACSSDGNKLAAAIPVLRGSAIYLSTDAGKTWTQSSAPTTNVWSGLASSADGSKLVAVPSGGYLFSSGPIYISTNSGATWELATNSPVLNWSAVASSADGAKLFATASTTGPLGTQPAGIYVSTNSGRVWLPGATNLNSSSWPAVACSADGRTVVAAVTGSAFSGGNQIYISTDSGSTWRNAGAPVRLWNCVASSADGCKLAAGATNPAYGTGPTNGQIYIWRSAPNLDSKISASGLTLSWPQEWTGYVLRQNSDLTTTNWTNVPWTANLTNGQNQIVISPTNTQNFYRLEFH